MKKRLILLLAGCYSTLIFGQSLETDYMIGSITGDTINYAVYLPASYETDVEREYPVLYHLHGKNMNYDNWLNSVYLPGFLEDTWSSGVWEEAILIIPDGGDSSLWCDSYSGDFHKETNLIQELVPFVDSSFRTSGARYIQGSSMGGFGALRMISKYPTLFCKAITIDGALYQWGSMSPSIRNYAFSMNESYFNETADPRTFLVENSDQFTTVNRIYLTVAIMEALNMNVKDLMDEHLILNSYESADCLHNMKCVMDSIGYELYTFFEGDCGIVGADSSDVGILGYNENIRFPYPNPTRGLLWVYIGDESPIVELYNINGQRIYETTGDQIRIDEELALIDISAYQRGIYFILIGNTLFEISIMRD